MAGVFQVYEVQDDLRYFWQHWDESQAGMAAHAQQCVQAGSEPRTPPEAVRPPLWRVVLRGG